MIDDYKLLELYKLKNVVRYSTRTTINKETVAEHSFYVALLALMLCDELKVDDKIKSQCLTKAILHDMPESELNDITHDVKVKLGLYEYLKKYEDNYFEKHFKKHSKLMKDNSDSLINLIVGYADILSVKQYCLNEKALGNASYQIDKILADTKERIKDIATKLSTSRRLKRCIKSQKAMKTSK